MQPGRLFPLPEACKLKVIYWNWNSPAHCRVSEFAIHNPSETIGSLRNKIWTFFRLDKASFNGSPEPSIASFYSSQESETVCWLTDTLTAPNIFPRLHWNYPLSAYLRGSTDIELYLADCSDLSWAPIQMPVPSPELPRPVVRYQAGIPAKHPVVYSPYQRPAVMDSKPTFAPFTNPPFDSKPPLPQFTPPSFETKPTTLPPYMRPNFTASTTTPFAPMYTSIPNFQ